MKKIGKVLFGVLGAIVLAAVLFFGWLTVREYKPADVETLEILSAEKDTEQELGDSFRVMSWNTGYAGLGAESDFYMDGGSHVQAADRETVQRYLSGIEQTLEENAADAYLLQEVDSDSKRSYGIDERTGFMRANSTYALNFSVDFVPSGWPPIGKVHSGLLTTTDYAIESAERISLPCPFSWPVRTANLKRCLNVSYLPLEGTDAKLCLINLHLEAYDSGEGKIAQTNRLRDFMQQEYEKGNYVLAGGDFNQVFPGSREVWPNTHTDLWEPGVLDDSMLPEGWAFACDVSTPTCRLLNQPYDPADTENTQYYVIDGFIVSPNLVVDEVHTVDAGFENSDHNPVLISLHLAESETDE